MLSLVLQDNNFILCFLHVLAASAVFQGGAFGLAGMFPKRFMQALMSGGVSVSSDCTGY